MRKTSSQLIEWCSAYFFLPMVVPERKSNRFLNLATLTVAALTTFLPDHKLCVS